MLSSILSFLIEYMGRLTGGDKSKVNLVSKKQVGFLRMQDVLLDSCKPSYANAYNQDLALLSAYASEYCCMQQPENCPEVKETSNTKRKHTRFAKVPFLATHGMLKEMEAKNS